MALTVQTNNAAVTALKHLNTNSAHMNQSLERLSSGFRINSAADDASGYAISSKLAAQGERLKAASNNAMQANAMVKMADAAVQEIQNMITRIQTLATQGASANNTAELAKLEAERVKLENQIDNLATSTKYNGVPLLHGGAASSFQVGSDNAADNRVSVDFSLSYKATSLGLAGGAAATLTTQAAAQTYITTASTALDTLVTNRAALGASQNQIGFVVASLATAIEQVTSSVSVIRDADMAAEMANFTKNQILVQAGTAMLTQANQASQNVTQLFR